MKLSIIIFFIVIFFSFLKLEGKNQLPYGVKFDYLKTDDETNITNLTNEPFCCPIKMLGNGESYSLGLSYSFIDIIGIENLIFSINGNVNYYKSFIYFDEKEAINVNGEAFNGTIRHSVDFSSFSIKPELSIKYSYSSIFMKYNFGLDLFLNNEFTQKEAIIFPVDRGVFEDTQTRTRNVVDSKIENLSIPISNSFIFGIEFEYKSKVKISTGIIIGVRNSISSYFDWRNRFYGLNIGIDFLGK